MANKSIPNLQAFSGAMAGTEVLELAANDISYRITSANILKVVGNLTSETPAPLSGYRIPLFKISDGLTYSCTLDQIHVAAGTVPAGGSAGQLLAKVSGTDYDTAWTSNVPTVSIANGGTGQVTATAGFDALAPTTTRGDLIARGASSNGRLAIGATARLLRSDGTDPSWAQAVLTTDVTGVLPVANGGTGLSSGTSGGILGLTASGTVASSVALTANAIVLGGGAGATPTPMGSLGTTTTVLHGNAGGAPTFSAVSMSADVTGTLPIANGGTGQTTATAAFDALAPTTTRGDIIFRNATVNTRLAASTSGYLLQTNGAGTDPTWAGFLQAGTGGATRTWLSKAKEHITPYDFGAVGDGTTNDRTALANADTAAAALGATLVLTDGTFKIDSAITFTSRVLFLGGKVKPANTIVVTFSGSLSAIPYQIFDVGLGGSIAGTPYLGYGCINGEWWGALPDRSTDCAAALNSALTFQGQYTRGTLSSVMGYSAPLELQTGTYRITAPLTIAHNGSCIRGQGMWSSALEVSDAVTANGIVAINVVEQWGEVDDAFGHRFHDFAINGGYDAAGSLRTAGAGIQMTYIRSASIERMYFRGNFIGVLMLGCKFGTPGKYVNDCYFYAHDVGTGVAPTTGSAHIKLTMTAADITAVNDDRHCSHIHITGCHGDGTAAQYGIWCRALDTAHITGNHFFAADQGQIVFDNTTGPVINVHCQGNTWEVGISSIGPPTVQNSAYAIQFLGSTLKGLNTFMFVNEQILNGSTAVINMDSADLYDCVFSNCIVTGSGGRMLFINKGTAIKYNGCIFEDANLDNSTTFAYVEIGATGTPVDVEISNCSTYQRATVYAPSYGMWLRGGTNIRISDCSIQGWNPAAIYAIKADIAATAFTVSNCYTGAAETTVSSTPIGANPFVIIPLGCDFANITGTASIATFDATTTDNCAFQGRKIHLTFASGLTLQTSGNLELAGDVDYAIPASKWIELQYDTTDSKWKETAREKTWLQYKVGAHAGITSGPNSNIAIPSDSSLMELTADPGGAFSISGFAGGYAGRVLIVDNPYTQAMTITNDATSTAANRIYTRTGADVVTTNTGGNNATFVYSATAASGVGRWILVSVQG